MIPIWKDTNYVINGEENSTFEYSIRMYDGVIQENGRPIENWVYVFNGKAWAKPITNEISININDICKDYLKSELPDIRHTLITQKYTQEDSVKRFRLYNNNGVVVAEYQFILDWSYESINYNNRPTNLSRPINGRAKEGMMGLYTRLNEQDKVETIISPSIGGLNDELRTQAYTLVENACNAKYALYYLNRYGGWDCFLIEGNVTKKDTYNRFYIDTPYNNTTIEFGKKVYHNEIVASYELHTSWLNDVQSSNLAFNLLSSNMVYIHNLEENTIEPVVIVDADATYKTFKNQGNKLCNYTINVECSQKQHNN